MTTIVISVLATICATGFIGCIAFLVRRELQNQSWRQKTEKRLTELEADLEMRQQTLIDALNRGPKHYTHNTIAALQDATAVFVDAKMDIETLNDRLQTGIGIIQAAAKGPRAYDPERPAGRRK